MNNGGSTETHALVAGSLASPASPAIDAYLTDVLGSCGVATDQRGVARPQDGDGDTFADCDIGSFEVALCDTAIPTSGCTVNGLRNQACEGTGDARSAAGSESQGRIGLPRPLLHIHNSQNNKNP